ncbi:hypothetical protein EDD21DRAFT_368485 [Dissophora ornata]|nr:hypothetical protein EDD21DRAFT_368485 [Dissophora ornata]
MSEPDSHADLPPSQQIADSKVSHSMGAQNSKLQIATDLPSLSSSSQPAGSQPLGSPINRKRAEVKDDDGCYGLEHHQDQEGGARANGSPSSLPPLKKSKTSFLLSQESLTAYRSSQEIAEEQISPQTSPYLDPTSPVSVSPSTEPTGVLTPPSGGASTPVIPILARSSTLEEIKPSSVPSSFANSAGPWIENLSLGTRTDSPPSRVTGVERAMGIITGSRQGSPALLAAGTVTNEPMHLDQESDQNGGQSSSPSASDSTANSERTDTHRAVLNLSPDYNEDADDDYELEADTTVDENYNRVDTSDSEDDDSFSDIDINNIRSGDSDDEPRGTPYHDMDPLCLDRLTEEEKTQIIDEAREFGVGHIIQEYVMTGIHSVKKLLLMTVSGELKLGVNLTENDLISILVQRLQRELRRRHRLPDVHTLEHVIDLLKRSKNIMVLTGAGVSVSCGIPDFRSSDGIYSRLSEFELDDPTQMFELEFFRRKPQVFYSFAREIFPSNFTPSPSHKFIKLLEDHGKLLRNYTQNIDTLEQKAGIQRVLQCHGSFATASCVRCHLQVPGDDIKEAILKQEVAYCRVCQSSSPGPNSLKKTSDEDDGDSDNDCENDSLAVMKPDIVFFGERLPPAFDDSLDEDRDRVDLLIVIGSSLKVAPVSDIMHQLPNNIPQILINRTPITHMEFDVQLLGNCDTIVAELCRMAGWELKHEKLPGGTSNVPDMDTNMNADGSGRGGRAQWSVIEPNTYTFEGAILGDVEYESSQSSSKKRGRFENHGTEGYDADSDGESEGLRRRSFAGSERRSSLGFMDTDTDTDSESDDSQYTIRDLQANLPSIAADDSFASEPPWKSLTGFAVGTTEPRSGSIPEIHLPHASLSVEIPSLLRSTSTDSHMEHREEDEEETRMRMLYTEKMPLDLDAESLHGETGGGHGMERRLSVDLGPIAEDPQHEQDDEDGPGMAQVTSSQQESESFSFPSSFEIGDIKEADEA